MFSFHIVYINLLGVIFIRIVAICLVAVRRMRTLAVKHEQLQFDLAQSQLNLTHYSLPKKMPWIKC